MLSMSANHVPRKLSYNRRYNYQRAVQDTYETKAIWIPKNLQELL